MNIFILFWRHAQQGDSVEIWIYMNSVADLGVSTHQGRDSEEKIMEIPYYKSKCQIEMWGYSPWGMSNATQFGKNKKKYFLYFQIKTLKFLSNHCNTQFKSSIAILDLMNFLHLKDVTCIWANPPLLSQRLLQETIKDIPFLFELSWKFTIQNFILGLKSWICSMSWDSVPQKDTCIERWLKVESKFWNLEKNKGLFSIEGSREVSLNTCSVQAFHSRFMKLKNFDSFHQQYLIQIP